MSPIDVDAISLMIGLLEKAKYLCENAPGQSVDLTTVVETELLNM